MNNYSKRCIEKLKELGAPLTGWFCESVDDAESADCRCELCGYDAVRYVHRMKHPDWNDILKVGCVCDGTMSTDMLGAQERDRQAQNKAKRKEYLMSKQWEQCDERTYKLKNTRGVISAELNNFKGRKYFIISVRGDLYQWWNNKRITDLQTAKEFIFFILEYEREQKSRA